MTLLSNRQEFLTRDGKERKAARSQALLLEHAMAPTIHAPGMLPKEDGATMPGAGLTPTRCWHGAKWHPKHCLVAQQRSLRRKQEGELAPLMIKD